MVNPVCTVNEPNPVSAPPSKLKVDTFPDTVAVAFPMDKVPPFNVKAVFGGKACLNSSVPPSTVVPPV